MRLRFSTRSLLLAVIFLALACYFAFVRPTVLAQKFLDAVNAKDFRQADSLCGDSNENYFIHCMQKSESYDVVDAKLFPRRWSDLCKLQQRLSVTLVPTKPQEGLTFVVGIRADIVATSSGIKPPLMYPITYQR
jgi:hypothetical protein